MDLSKITFWQGVLILLVLGIIARTIIAVVLVIKGKQSSTGS